MFVDSLTLHMKAGDGGDGVTRWRHEKFRPMAGPAGGNGGRGGDVFLRAVRDVNLLAKYTGDKNFEAQSGEDGQDKSKFGKNGDDLYVDVPVGSIVTDLTRERVYELLEEGLEIKILKVEVAVSATNSSRQQPIAPQRNRQKDGMVRKETF
ncbi:MAG: hypothetical protein R3B53_01855 [Candidatus Paceibacterota bacterium]